MALSGRTTLIARILGCPACQVTSDTEGLKVATRGVVEVVPYRSLSAVRCKEGLLWTDMTIEQRAGQPIPVRGLARRHARLLSSGAALYGGADEVESTLNEYALPEGRSQYLTKRLHDRWVLCAQRVSNSRPSDLTDPKLPRSAVAKLTDLRTLLAGGEKHRQLRNDHFVTTERIVHESLLLKGQGYPLNDDQINAVLHDEDRALVVAGAGTGKTSTIVGKALYLIKGGRAKPQEILLLAFTRKAAEEMEERFQGLGVNGLTVKTFHSLGLTAIAQSTSKKPSLSKLAEDDKALSDALQRFLKVLAEDGHLGPLVVEFLAYHRYPYHDPESFDTAHKYHQHIAGHNVRSLKGERLKSIEESLVANWL